MHNYNITASLCVTDVPVIISGERVAYLDPQQHIWSPDPGQSYTLSALQGTDNLTPFDGISNFKSNGMSSYHKTIFRFPLRKKQSSMSKSLYDIAKVHKLIDSLREEAELLLPFLCSINTIEVYDIQEDGSQNLRFKTEISEKDKSGLGHKQKKMMDELRSAHSSRPYDISSFFDFSEKFSIQVTSNEESQESHWLVYNRTGSDKQVILDAAKEEQVFPRVGVAVQLDKIPNGGRIYCFLPMPVDMASNLPVHVNGTFGLTNDRRSLKWPGSDWQNDSTADWNETLVKEVLPQCYVSLLCEATKHLTPDLFYQIWPDVAKVNKDTWGQLLEPLFKSLFSHPVFWAEGAREWILANQGVFVQRNTKLDPVIQQTLESCGLKVVSIPQNVWASLKLAGHKVIEINPELVRNELKQNSGYMSLDRDEKCVILDYCLSDEQYSKMQGLHLIPLLSGEFAQFQEDSKKGVSAIFVSSKSYPSSLLPNLSHKMVDLLEENPELHKKLVKLAEAKPKATQVRPLLDREVAELLEQAMPAAWKSSTVVDFPSPDSGFSKEWLEAFWKWVERRKLRKFDGKIVLPVSAHLTASSAEFCVTKLNSLRSSVLYIPSGQSCNRPLRAALDRLKVFACHENDFLFVRHKDLKTFVKEFNANGLLDAISCTTDYTTLEFTTEEAEALREFLLSSSTLSLNQQRSAILKKLVIFATAENTNRTLMSLEQIKSRSRFKKLLSVPSDSRLDWSKLPDTFTLLSRVTNQSQTKPLQDLGVAFQKDTTILLKHVLPSISVQKKSFPDSLLDNFMVSILNAFDTLQYDKQKIISELKKLPFVSVNPGCRKCPKDLFDPRDDTIRRVFEGEAIFPISPYDKEEYLEIMVKKLDLRTVIEHREILDIVQSIAVPPSPDPQHVDEQKFARAKAVLDYICDEDFLKTLPNEKKFGQELAELSKSLSWIPLLAAPPSGYPPELRWKGASYSSALMSLQTESCTILSSDKLNTVPLLVGSQVLFSHPLPEPRVAKMLQPNFNELATKHVTAHLLKVIRYSSNCEAAAKEDLRCILQHIYRELDRNNRVEYFSFDPFTSNWLYVEYEASFKFVKPSVAALKKNSTFRYDLDPYLFILPRPYENFSSLFLRYGMQEYISCKQIMSVLAHIRDDISQGILRVPTKQAWEFVKNILEWLTKNHSTLAREPEVYIPVDSDGQLQLENARDVLYCDNEFMREFASSKPAEKKLLFSHPFINADMAMCLGLNLLSDKMDISEDTGPHIELDKHLVAILKEYKDHDLTIIKELIQNADDAEADEINICFDNRHHQASEKRLIFPGMIDSHGPALVVHNNRPFSDDDFANITKLEGATKENMQLKIGKFGIGFCSVYHLTDVPSFVSRDLLHIFDPTLKYLGSAIKNRNQPGKKMKFTEEVISYSEQLDPFVGLFGFEKDKSYNGTLFRFPFRKEDSNLSTKHYDESNIMQMLNDLQKCSSKLLLFLRNINHITFQRIDEGQTEPTVLFEVHRSFDEPVQPQISLMEFTSKQDSTQPVNHEHWLVANNQTYLEGKYAIASVACPLSRHSSSAFRVSQVDGEVFCFLPLSQKQGLPVHVSANFAVMKNRRGIWTSDAYNDGADAEISWNTKVVRHVIPAAYHNLLVALQQMFSMEQLTEYTFHKLWPVESDYSPWKELLPPLYKEIAKSQLFLSTTSRWLKLGDFKILDENILSTPASNSTVAECCMQVIAHLNLLLVELPVQYHNHLGASLKNTLLTERDFVQLFFQNLPKLENMTEKRNEVIQKMLEIYAMECSSKTDRHSSLHEYLKEHACIPSSPNGVTLRRCADLVDPESPYAELFEENRGHFPDKTLATFRTSLGHLGMFCDEIPLEMLAERAKMVSSWISDKENVMHCVKLILKCLERASEEEDPSQDLTQFSKIPFLPVLQRPEDKEYLIESWKGAGVELSSGEELVSTGATDSQRLHIIDYTTIAGSQVLFINEKEVKAGGCGQIPEKVKQILKISFPSCTDAINQLKLLIDSSKTHPTMPERVGKMCEEIYRFLNYEIAYAHKNHMPAFNFTEMNQLPCIWTGSKFVYIKQIAKKWDLDGPHLFQVPEGLMSQPDLCSALQIKEKFTPEDVLYTLQLLKEEFQEEPIHESDKEVFKALLPLLDNIQPAQFDTEFKIPLPDQNFVLRWSSELAYNDAHWAPQDDNYTFVNDIISSSLAKQLLIKPISSEVLDKYELKEKSFFVGEEFGQRENLTLRIRNILQEYSLDISILKELLQNADDAKATKLHFILDKRTHGQKRVFSENWQKLQGPALLVWNNKIFSDQDLKGIQDLGQGGKRQDPESIGQYGIGFNAVYHLTDCPSFVTGSDTLCILDPHCRFVPGATPKSPGRMISGEFWEKYPDVKSAYLQDELEGISSEIRKGTLFRFPLRHSPELVLMSEIIGSEEQAEPDVECHLITAKKMHSYLRDWAPKMKDSMFFLNHVTELKFCTIEENSCEIVTEHHFETHVDAKAQEKRELLHMKVANFKSRSGNESCLIHYPLTLSDVGTNIKEHWIIQQGVGDIHQEDRDWQFVKQVKPKHGLAAPLKFPAEKTGTPVPEDSVPPSEPQQVRPFRGQVFCFLPLPSIESHLPVHVNGNFILDSTRRYMWPKNDPSDKKSAWNTNLIEAIGSSYAIFLENIKEYYFPFDIDEPCPSLVDAVQRYYSVFPGHKGLDRLWQSLSGDVYDKLVVYNAPVMAVFSTEPSSLDKGTNNLHWYSCTVSPMYFWKSNEGQLESDQQVIWPILENLGMKITSAPLQLMASLNEALKRKSVSLLVPVSPDTVYQYYCEHFNHCCLSDSGFPCPISNTAFHTVGNFKQFTLYMLTDKDQFPKPPFGVPLLLTEDGLVRCFDNTNRVVSSEYSGTFPRSQHKFLHHEMLDIKYTSEYFTLSLERGNGLKVVEEILSCSLHKELLASSKVKNDGLVSSDMLESLWKCFENDPMFKEYLSDIVKVCAVIPSTNGYLFSSRSHLQPIFPDDTKTSIKLTEVLRNIGMPFVDTSLVSLGTNCLELTDPSKVLKNLYYLFYDGVCTNAQMNKSNVAEIVKHIKSINFRFNTADKEFVTSIPLYETMDGKFVSICGKTVYEWPPGMCIKAYKKWSQHIDAIFLNPKAAWTSLCPKDPELLGVKSIKATEIYVEYVFKYFSLLTDEERYSHLEYIREKLYADSKYEHSQKRSSTSKFIESLCELKCLRAEDNSLRRVQDFCDHNQVIFKTFSQEFQFLPSSFRDGDTAESWMTFFKELGLRKTVTQTEFRNFCTSVSKCQYPQARLTNASKTLVQYLWSEATISDKWHLDTDFLSQLSEIPFVLVLRTEQLNWIALQANPACTFEQHSFTTIGLTSLLQSATVECSSLLWTVKPIVDLNLPQNLTSDVKELVSGLKVTEKAIMNSDDIVANVSNIVHRSHFADFSLFDTYPEKLMPPQDVTSLMDVMLEIFQHLLQQGDFKSDALQSLPCIPVYSTPDANIKWQLVLVHPCYVINHSEVGKFHPYLHRLPKELSSVYPLLMELGVKSDIDLSHIQVVLKKAYTKAEGAALEANTHMCVVETLKRLKVLIQDKDPRELVKNLKSLYLPTSDGKLQLSTDLMYCDTRAYRDKLDLSLHDSTFAQLRIRSSECGFTDSDLCELLPESIRPKRMSELCKQEIVSPCDQEVQDSHITASIKQTMQVSLIPEAALRIIVQYAKVEDAKKKMKPLINSFLANIKIVTVQNLNTSIKFQESGKEIGKAKIDFFLQQNDCDCCLYLDSKIQSPFVDYVTNEIVDHILSKVVESCPRTSSEALKSIEDMMRVLFKVQDNSQVEVLLDRAGIAMQRDDKMEFPPPELGKEIPRHIHHRLDQDIDNIFYPTEWVGYEDQETRIVFAQVVYPILSEDATDFETIRNLEMKYKIYLRSDDLEGSDVSTLDLYKFIKGRSKVKVELQPTDAVTVHEGDTAEVEGTVDSEYTVHAKETIRKELQEIWQLPEELRKKALKRLYLKWHPDKNQDNSEYSEEVFKFLLRQIKQMEDGETTSSENRPPDSSNWHSGSWFHNFSASWNDIAQSHFHSFKREQSYYSSRHHSHPSGLGAYSSSLNKKDNTKEGWRWIRQAEVDFGMLKANNKIAQDDATLKGHGLVCFLAHQVAEKALQGGVYAICGKDERNITDHFLSDRAKMIRACRLPETIGLLSHVTPLEDYYLNTRYPNRWQGYVDIPADHYSDTDAELAVQHADIVLEMVKNLMPPLHD